MLVLSESLLVVEWPGRVLHFLHHYGLCAEDLYLCQYPAGGPGLVPGRSVRHSRVDPLTRIQGLMTMAMPQASRARRVSDEPRPGKKDGLPRVYSRQPAIGLGEHAKLAPARLSRQAENAADMLSSSCQRRDPSQDVHSRKPRRAPGHHFSRTLFTSYQEGSCQMCVGRYVLSILSA